MTLSSYNTLMQHQQERHPDFRRRHREPDRWVRGAFACHNKILCPTGAYVVITANKNGYDVAVEASIYENDFIKVSGTPTHGIYNNGVAAPAERAEPWFGSGTTISSAACRMSCRPGRL